MLTVYKSSFQGSPSLYFRSLGLRRTLAWYRAPIPSLLLPQLWAQCLSFPNYCQRQITTSSLPHKVVMRLEWEDERPCVAALEGAPKEKPAGKCLRQWHWQHLSFLPGTSNSNPATTAAWPGEDQALRAGFVEHTAVLLYSTTISCPRWGHLHLELIDISKIKTVLRLPALEPLSPWTLDQLDGC